MEQDWLTWGNADRQKWAVTDLGGNLSDIDRPAIYVTVGYVKKKDSYKSKKAQLSFQPKSYLTISHENQGYSVKSSEDLIIDNSLFQHARVLNFPESLKAYHENKFDDDSFLDSIRSMYSKDERDKAVEHVYSYFGDLILNKQFEKADKILRDISNENFSTWILLPFLTLTRPFKKELLNRSDLFANAMVKFTETLTMKQLKSTIGRLK